MFTRPCRVSGTRFSVLLTAASLCYGQAGKAELFGTIQDPSGALVPNAKVQAQSATTAAEFTATSDERGEYHLVGLPVGQYSLSVEQPGFRTYRQEGIALRTDDRTFLDIKLMVGQPAESVQVTADASLLETATGQVSFALNKAKIETLP